MPFLKVRSLGVGSREFEVGSAKLGVRNIKY